jgi:hypothetical protein
MSWRQQKQRNGVTVSVSSSLFSGALIVGPGQQLLDAIDIVFRNEGKDVCQPSLRIDLVELRRLDQRVGYRRGSASRI